MHTFACLLGKQLFKYCEIIFCPGSMSRSQWCRRFVLFNSRLMRHLHRRPTTSRSGRSADGLDFFKIFFLIFFASKIECSQNVELFPRGKWYEINSNAWANIFGKINSSIIDYNLLSKYYRINWANKLSKYIFFCLILFWFRANANIRPFQPIRHVDGSHWTHVPDGMLSGRMAEMRLQVQPPYSLQIQGIVGDSLINVRQEPMWFMFSDAICRWRNDSNFSNNYPLLHAAPELKLHDRTSALLSACLSFGHVCDIPSFRNKNRRKSYSWWTNTLPLVRSDFEWVCVRVCVCMTDSGCVFVSLWQCLPFSCP